jgi:hypothetical protein
MHDKLKALHILANHLGIFNNFYNAVSVLAQHGINIAPDPHNPNQWQVINGSRLDEPPPQKINGFREPKPEPPERENAIFDLPINQ